MITETQLKQAVNRFLCWRMPDTFGPDCFITFDREKSLKNYSWPVGTNLLTAHEAEMMLRHALEGVIVPDSPSPMLRAGENLVPAEPAKEATPNDLVQALQANTKALQRLNKQLERWDVNGLPQQRVGS